MNVAIIDDQQTDLNNISNIIKDYADKNHIDIDLSAFHNAESFLSNYRPFKYTLIFMDIYMDNMTGIDAARKVREMDKDTPIIFLTTSEDHTLDAFEVHAYHYIIKCVEPAKLKDSVFKVLADITSMQNIKAKNFTFTYNGMEHSIAYHNIKFVQSSQNYVQITDRYENLYRLRMTYSKIYDILGADKRFLQINRGILINMDYIRDFTETTCILEGDCRFPINIRESKSLNQIRKNYIFSKLQNNHLKGGRSK